MQPFATAPPQQRHAAASGPPQYAEFEMAKKGQKGPEDSLPQMPSWETAGAKKVLVEDEDGVEMDQLKKPNNQDPRFARVGSPGSGPVSPMSSMDGRNPYSNHNSQGSYMGAAGIGGAAAGAAYAQGRRPTSPYSPRDQQFHNQPPGPGNRPYGPGRGPNSPGFNQGFNQHGYNQDQGHNQMLNPPNDYSANRISDGYGLDQPYDQPQPSGGPLAATAAAAGLTGVAAGAALGAGAASRGSPSPGPHGYGQPPQAQAGAGAGQGYAEMPAEPSAYGQAVDNQNQNQTQNQFAEMPAEPRGSDQNVHAVFAEMPAGGQSRTSPEAKKQNNAHYFEMPTDQVAPIELDSGFVPAIQTTNAQAGNQGSSQSPTAQSPQDQHPHGYGMQRRGTGDAPNDPYSRQGSADRSSPEGYGMQRRGTGDNSGAGSPSPYGMDPRMRASPGPMSSSPRSPGPRSPGPRSPGPRNSPGPRRPVPRGDQPFAPSPLSTPVPQNESAYNRPGYNSRTYSPAPRAQRSPDHNVPVSRPTQQTAFAEPQPQSPITNNAGFDFTSGFSRPQDSFDRRPSESHEPASREGYPGYKPYNQAQGGWSGV